ncbi:hypothetical protein COB11_02430 [Candidatus Aerophobetes bacterium]|uniref:Uncharacterized protein n=1 Tax=Aerophobetes bacterium TaxID=2030807 RepID=A0A2A4YKK1_UNCAE|nr:MAG: hypothetical protein COB11_02430 [Candidatus Aerophobetes bacterium]
MTLVATNLNKVIPTIFFDEDNTLSPLMALKDPFSTMSSPRVGDFYSKEPLSLSNHSKPMQIDGKYTIPLVYDEEEALLFPRIEDSNQYFATPKKLSKDTHSNHRLYPLDEYEEEYIQELPNTNEIILRNINNALEEMHFDGTLEILKHKWGV